MAQTCEELLFAHWRVREDELRQLVPEALRLDTFDGAAWLGVTPFRVTGLRPRGTVPLPRISSFLQLNVRTYVALDDRPGIWFFGLDASNRLAVEAARRIYRLPYFRARMSASRHGGWIEYESAREGAADEPHVFSAHYRPAGEPSAPAPGSLEEFLTERYCLYAPGDRGRLCRAEIHHVPWPLRRAEARVELNTMAPHGLELPEENPLLHFAERQDLVIWPLAAV